MIKEFCDRCGVEVGQIDSSGLAVPKFHLDGKVLEAMSGSKSYLVCAKCHTELLRCLADYFPKVVGGPNGPNGGSNGSNGSHSDPLKVIVAVEGDLIDEKSLHPKL